MTKKRSIFLIIFLSIILVIGLLASFVSFTYPFTINGNYYHYSSFVRELVLGSDVSNGVVVTYRASLPENEPSSSFDDYMNNTVLGLEEILSDAGYKDSSVVTLGDNQIQVIVGNVSTYEEQQEAIGLIGNPQKLKFSSSSSATTENEFDISGKYVKDIQVKSQDGNGITVYYVDIQMTSEGKAKLKSLTQDINTNGGTMYMYLGETSIASMDSKSLGVVTDGHLTMYSEENFVDKNTTQSYVNSIKTGLLDMDLTQLESSQITATMGNRVGMWIAIAFAVMVVASFVFLAVKYRELGGMAIFNTLYFIVIGLGLLQSIPFIHFNIGGLLGLALCYILSFDALTNICETAKQEYASGKKLHTCFKLAQKKCLWQILIPNIFVFVSGVVCALIPNVAVASFGGIALVLSLVNIFTSLVWFRVMLKLYSALNFYKGERCNFKVEEARNVK